MASVHQIPAFPSTQSAHTNRKRSNTTSTRSTFTSTYDEKGYPLQLEYPVQPRHRSSTVSGYSYQAATPSDSTSTYSYTPASDTSYTQSTRSSPRPEPARNTPSPTPSISSSSSSGKSVQFSDVWDCAIIGVNHQRYSPNHRKCPSKASLFGRKVEGVARSLLSTKNRDTKHASLAVDKILYEVVVCVKKFKCPSELDFSAGTGSPLNLPYTEKNKPFIEQLQRLDALRTSLASISTHDAEATRTEYVEKKHAETGAAIETALERMKQHQLRLYDQFARSALDDLALHLNASVKQFQYPSELDFLPGPTDGLVLSNTKRNQSFIGHLRKLDWFQQELSKIHTNDNDQLQDRSRAIGVAIERALVKAKKRQLQIFRSQNRV